ncbi:hypothetical protein [Paraferrimonas haliotis]|uniref:hypothetical protein n=1 Tax=Paraferrimonas haliotis TaxID=2013866 RepID=UPI000BA94037|nr:hypothetical protein [Paraferrimonas haliotis]
MNWQNWMRIAHWGHSLGILLVIAAAWGYFATDVSNELTGMVAIASAFAIGLLMMAPYPVMLFISWARKQDRTGN